MVALGGCFTVRQPPVSLPVMLSILFLALYHSALLYQNCTSLNSFERQKKKKKSHPMFDPVDCPVIIQVEFTALSGLTCESLGLIKN